MLFGLILVLATVTCFGQHYLTLQVPGSPYGICTMLQDSPSALWLGTIDDVYCFDGERFYSLRPYGFPKEAPISFAEDSEGGIWIATDLMDTSLKPHAAQLNRATVNTGHRKQAAPGARCRLGRETSAASDQVTQHRTSPSPTNSRSAFSNRLSAESAEI